jgi:hypothetical protein
VSDRVRKFYQTLFRKVVRDFGAFDVNTRTAIIGFGGGGPVSFLKVAEKPIYVTCELSQYSEQVRSVEGLKFELLAKMRLAEDEIRSLFTGLGNLSMQARLGDGHTIDVSTLSGVESLGIVTLRLFSTSRFRLRRYGVYEVVRVTTPNKSLERTRGSW